MVTTADCAGCTFPPANAPSCASGPPISLVYPPDTVLLPPNMNVISVQWTPFGGGYQRFSVDFESPPNTDWHIVTSCANQTTDMQAGGSPSGGCEITVDPVSWSKLVTWNRDSGPVAVTVRGTTDGQCASASNTININFAKEDLLGTYYYWKSTVTSGQGVGGQIWAKIFGDLNTNEQDVTSNVATSNGTLQATCNGCHALSRDGTRMVVYSDDNDSDDEYTDVGGSLLDMTPLPGNPPTELGVGVSGSRQGGQPPGFTAINPLASYYVSSNGIPLTASGKPPTGFGAGSSTTAGYSSAVPANAVSLWDGMGNFVNPVSIGGAMTRPTMPDWSVDGKTVIYVQPSSVASFQLFFDFGGNAKATDDDHIYGGSLYTVPYMGAGMFGAPAVFLQSGGENNYYPSFSPDGDSTTPPSFVLFNRVANNAGAGTSCNNGLCPNDSFSNPDARLTLLTNKTNATPTDLEKANGSRASMPVSLSNSYPRWAPFVQTYHGNKILWFTFSSTRDYGVRILNHKMGMYQCYPPDTPEVPAAMHGSTFDAACQQPQIWMAPILFSEGQSASADPSRVAFWIPYQDMSTHNHTAQWTWQASPPPSGPDGGTNCTCSTLYGKCGAANGGCGCCSGQQLTCNGSGQCIMPAN
jgi:hypothetical protein